MNEQTFQPEGDPNVYGDLSANEVTAILDNIEAGTLIPPSKEHQKRAVRWHDGFRVDSSAIPIHEAGMYVEVPRRLKRKDKREFAELWRRTALPEKHGEHLTKADSDWHLVEFLLKMGVRWNWKDEDGNPFPQPEDDPNVYDELSDDEVVFILDNIEAGTTIPPPKGTG